MDQLLYARELAKHIAKARIISGRDPLTEDQAVVLIMYAMEHGFIGISSLSFCGLLKGKPYTTAAGLQAIAEREGWITRFVTDEKKSTCTLTKEGRDPVVVTYTIDDATKAGLASSNKVNGIETNNWIKQPKSQLEAAASRMAIRRACPAAAMGVYTDQELRDFDFAQQSAQQPEPAPETAEISTADIMAKVKEFYAGWVGYFRELGANDKEIGVAFKNAFAVDRFSEWTGWNVSTIAGFNSAVDQANYLVNEQYADYQAKHTQPAEEPAAPETVEEKPANQVARSESKAAAARFIENILAKGYTVSQINEALELPMETDLIEWDGWQAFGAVDKARDKFMNWASNHALTAQQPAQKSKPHKGMFANPPAENS